MHDSSNSSGSLLMSHAVMLVGGLATAGMACATWRAVDTAIDHNAAAMAAQQHQNLLLVESIKSLADQAGILTSADLCPVRFRLRSGEGHSVPVLPPFASLEGEIDGDFTELDSTVATRGGHINFGLNPPGRYRLTILMNDGMRLRHEFDVIPGVPLDRMIVCPRRSVNARVSLAVALPQQLQRQGVLAVCRIEPMSFAHGDWVWQPSPEWNTVYSLDSGSQRELGAADLLLLDQLIPLPDDSDHGYQPAAGLNVPFRYCRLTRITFLGPFGETRELTALGTAVFESEPLESQPEHATTWYCNASAPTYEITGTGGHWIVPLPDSVVDELLHQIQDLTAEREPAGSLKAVFQRGSPGREAAPPGVVREGAGSGAGDGAPVKHLLTADCRQPAIPYSLLPTPYSLPLIQSDSPPGSPPGESSPASRGTGWRGCRRWRR